MNSLRPNRPRRSIPIPGQMEKMFDRLGRGYGRRFRQRFGMGNEEWRPNVDIFERDNLTIVRADVPGVKPLDFDISAEDGILRIEGHREEEEAGEAEYYSECPLGRFSRTIELPQRADPNAIEASYKDGVLELRIPHSSDEQRQSTAAPIQKP